MAQAKHDIDVFGYCMWANALSEDEIAAMATRLVSQAEAEVRDGLAKDGATHFIGSIINKGEEFEPLLTHPEAEELLTHLLGEHYNLSTGFAKIVKPGAVAETLHTDQWWLPPPQIRERGPAGAVESQPEVRTGSITRELAYTAAMHSGDHVAMIAGEDGGSPRPVSFIHVRREPGALLRFRLYGKQREHAASAGLASRWATSNKRRGEGGRQGCRCRTAMCPRRYMHRLRFALLAYERQLPRCRGRERGYRLRKR